jgi:hypothetical protein
LKFNISTEKLHHLLQGEHTAKQESDAEGKSSTDKTMLRGWQPQFELLFDYFIFACHLKIIMMVMLVVVTMMVMIKMVIALVSQFLKCQCFQ